MLQQLKSFGCLLKTCDVFNTCSFTTALTQIAAGGAGRGATCLMSPREKRHNVLIVAQYNKFINNSIRRRSKRKYFSCEIFSYISNEQMAEAQQKPNVLKIYYFPCGNEGFVKKASPGFVFKGYFDTFRHVVILSKPPDYKYKIM